MLVPAPTTLDAERRRLNAPVESFSFRLSILTVYGITVMVLMVMPVTGSLSRIPIPDKVSHLILFAVLGFLSSWALPKKHVIGITGSLVFAFLTEAVQFYLPYRQMDAVDLLADILGIGTGWLAYQTLRLRQVRRA